MRQFLYNISLFAIPIVVVIAALYLFCSYTERRRAQQIKVPSAVHKIIIGDSHTRTGLDDQLVKGSINYSNRSENFMYSYAKLRLLLAANPQIDTVYLGVNYHSFCAYMDEGLLNPEIASKYFFLLNKDEKIKLLSIDKNKVQLLLHAIANTIKDRLKHTYIYLGGFENYSTNKVITALSIQKRINEQFYARNQLKDTSAQSIFYLHKIQELCAAHNVQLIALNLPLHPLYIKNVPGFYKQFYEKQCRGLLLKQYHNLSFEANDFLPDGDHLSFSGAQKFSKQFQ